MQYELKLPARTVAIKAKKAEAEAITAEFTRLLDVRRYHQELSGVVGGRECSAVLMSLFGPPTKLADEQGFEQELTKLSGSLPDPLTVDNCQPFMKQARELFRKHLPVVDKRRTLADETIRQAEVAALESQRAAEAAEWRQIYCRDQPVTVPEGQMAVYLEMTFDDSDSQTDYFSPHAQSGDDMLLAIVPKQAERESLARRVLARYPELSKFAWTWHTENYSMGHGNYLMSEYTGHSEKRKSYDGREEVSTRWEIRFNSYQREMLAYRDYPGAMADTGPALARTDPTGMAVRHNEQRNGIEIQFPGKPPQETLERLKSLGFRWSKYHGIWYHSYTESLFDHVKTALE